MALGKGLNALIHTQAGAHTKSDATAVVDENQNSTEHRVALVPMSAIHPCKDQPRKDFQIDEMQELVSSIEQYGILQPILVKEESDGSYEIIAGERRFRACQMVGMTRIPCLVKGVDKKQQLEIALVENIQRKNLNPIEEAFAYQRLTHEFGMTQEQVGKQVGKSRPYIANSIRLLDLPQDIQKALIEEKISHSKARALLGLTTARQQLNAFYAIVGDKQMSTHETELMVRRHKRIVYAKEPILHAMENRIREKLGTKVTIVSRKGKGSVRVDFFSDEELQKIVQSMLGGSE